jgi:hypothetical protein
LPTRHECEAFGSAPLGLRLTVVLSLAIGVSVWAFAVYGLFKAVGAI